MAKKDDQYDKIKQRIMLADRWREDEGYDGKWQRLIDLYR